MSSDLKPVRLTNSQCMKMALLLQKMETSVMTIDQIIKKIESELGFEVRRHQAMAAMKEMGLSWQARKANTRPDYAVDRARVIARTLRDFMVKLGEQPPKELESIVNGWSPARPKG